MVSSAAWLIASRDARAAAYAGLSNSVRMQIIASCGRENLKPQVEMMVGYAARHQRHSQLRPLEYRQHASRDVPTLFQLVNLSGQNQVGYTMTVLGMHLVVGVQCMGTDTATMVTLRIKLVVLVAVARQKYIAAVSAVPAKIPIPWPAILKWEAE
jgi:hypothetical protein